LCYIAQHTERAPARPYPRRHMYIRTPDTVLRTHRLSGCVVVHYTYYSSKLCRAPSRGCWLTLIVSSGGFVVRTCNLTFVSLDFEAPGRETVTCQLQALLSRPSAPGPKPRPRNPTSTVSKTPEFQAETPFLHQVDIEPGKDIVQVVTRPFEAKPPSIKSA
jgi:hypothetical protein